MHVDFVRGIRVGDTVWCRGSVVHMGRRVTVADCAISSSPSDGEELLARGTCTFALDRPAVVR
jgi:acyl-coenzyme A thioesterase PaaI-like protein